MSMQTPSHDASATREQNPSHEQSVSAGRTRGQVSVSAARAGARARFIPRGRGCQGRRREGSPSEGGTECQANTFRFLYIVLLEANQRPSPQINTRGAHSPPPEKQHVGVHGGWAGWRTTLVRGGVAGGTPDRIGPDRTRPDQTGPGRSVICTRAPLSSAGSAALCSVSEVLGRFGLLQRNAGITTGSGRAWVQDHRSTGACLRFPFSLFS